MHPLLNLPFKAGRHKKNTVKVLELKTFQPGNKKERKNVTKTSPNFLVVKSCKLVINLVALQQWIQHSHSMLFNITVNTLFIFTPPPPPRCFADVSYLVFKVVGMGVYSPCRWVGCGHCRLRKMLEGQFSKWTGSGLAFWIVYLQYYNNVHWWCFHSPC